ncbi:MAG TPA: hypothetical protein PLE28_02110 [bacterium]|nr:hypothetical protein [bacterium]
MKKNKCNLGKSIKNLFSRTCHHRITGWPYVFIMMFFIIFLMQLIMLLLLVKIN